MMSRHNCITVGFILSGVLILALATSARADTYYVQQGSTTTRVDNADPASVTADYWLVEYYQRNKAVGATEPCRLQRPHLLSHRKFVSLSEIESIDATILRLA